MQMPRADVFDRPTVSIDRPTGKKTIGHTKRMETTKRDGKAPPLFSFRSERFGVLLMVAALLFSEGLMKTNMGMAMVCMVNTTKLNQVNNIPISSACNISQSISKQLDYPGTFHWSSHQQSSIFASFFWGGLAAVVVCTWFSGRYGPSQVLLITALVNVIGTFLTPLAAEIGVNWLICVRCVMGFGQGMLFPLSAAVVSSWFPMHEKSTVAAIYTSGNPASYTVAMLFSSQICQMDFLGGWKGIFYIYGFLGFLICALWFWIVTDTPLHSKKIKEVELQYILGNARTKRIQPPTPWLKMFASPIVLTLIMNTIGQQLTIVTLTTYLPQYFKHVLQMDLSSNGIWSALPFILQIFSKILFGRLSDGLRRLFPKRLDLVTKMVNCIATFGTAICLISIGFVSCGYNRLAITSITAATVALSANVGGFQTSLLSVAPLHTTSLNSAATFCGQASSVVTPYLVGYVTQNNTPEEWMTLFIIMGTTLCISGFAFLIFGTVEPLQWSLDEGKTAPSENKSNSSEKKF